MSEDIIVDEEVALEQDLVDEEVVVDSHQEGVMQEEALTASGEGDHCSSDPKEVVETQEETEETECDNTGSLISQMKQAMEEENADAVLDGENNHEHHIDRGLSVLLGPHVAPFPDAKDDSEDVPQDSSVSSTGKEHEPSQEASIEPPAIAIEGDHSCQDNAAVDDPRDPEIDVATAGLDLQVIETSQSALDESTDEAQSDQMERSCSEQMHGARPSMSKRRSSWDKARTKVKSVVIVNRLTASEREFEEQQQRYEESLEHLKRASQNMVSNELKQFRDVLKEKGRGNLTVGWRRYFDQDGDGILTFGEFCTALSQLNYGGDVLKLWGEVDSDKSNRISLDEIDPEGFTLLSIFKSWCVDKFGGPLEFFESIDDDGSESLTRQEFQKAIGELGWFDQQGLPESLDTEEEVMELLWPMLDCDGQGVVTPEEFLFLEPDKEKRAKEEKALHRKKMLREGNRGGFGGRPQDPSAASKLLHEVARSNTQLGGKHWKMIRSTDDNSLAYTAPEEPDAEAYVASAGTNAPTKVVQSPPPWLMSLATEFSRAEAACRTEAERLEWRKSKKNLEKLWRTEQKLQSSCPHLPPIQDGKVDPRGDLWQPGSQPGTPSSCSSLPTGKAVDKPHLKESFSLPQLNRSDVTPFKSNAAAECRRQEKLRRRKQEQRRKEQRRNIYKPEQVLPAIVKKGSGTGMPLLGVRPNKEMRRQESSSKYLMRLEDLVAPGATLDLFQHYYLK